MNDSSGHNNAHYIRPIITIIHVRVHVSITAKKYCKSISGIKL